MRKNTQCCNVAHSADILCTQCADVVVAFVQIMDGCRRKHQSIFQQRLKSMSQSVKNFFRLHI